MKKPFSKDLLNAVKWIVIVIILLIIVYNVSERLDMKNTIEGKSAIEISYFFKVLENEIFHTSSAFDSDYTWAYKLKVSKADIISISDQIEKSKFYNADGSFNFAEPIYDSIYIYNLKGFWVSESSIYRFYGAKEEFAEITDIEIDKANRTIKVNLIHL